MWIKEMREKARKMRRTEERKRTGKKMENVKKTKWKINLRELIKKKKGKQIE